MAQHKIGDIVRIREDLKGGDYYNNLYFAIGMEIYKGKIATITEATIIGKYSIDLDQGKWCWNDDMFENKMPTKEQLHNKISELEKQITELKEKAELEANREKYIKLFKQYVEQHSEPLDWNNELQDKWGIYYGHKSNIIGYTCVTTCKELFQIYASSKEILQEAIDFVGEENVKKYILEIKE